MRIGSVTRRLASHCCCPLAVGAVTHRHAATRLVELRRTLNPLLVTTATRSHTSTLNTDVFDVLAFLVIGDVYVKYARTLENEIAVRDVEKVVSELLNTTLNQDILDLIIQMTECKHFFVIHVSQPLPFAQT
jgi:hypothetical protein